MAEVLETARLLLRPWSDDDAAFLGRLASDPQVVRYIGDGQRWSPERVDQVSRMVAEHWRVNDFGWRVALPRETGPGATSPEEAGPQDADEPVGFVMLNYLGEGTAGLDPDEFEIGWWLVPSMWRRGLASEAAQAICREAFERVGAPSLVARLQPDNLASAGVAKRLGMSHEFDTTGRFGELVAVYRLRSPDR